MVLLIEWDEQREGQGAWGSRQGSNYDWPRTPESKLDGKQSQDIKEVTENENMVGSIEWMSR